MSVKAFCYPLMCKQRPYSILTSEYWNISRRVCDSAR